MSKDSEGRKVYLIDGEELEEVPDEEFTEIADDLDEDGEDTQDIVDEDMDGEEVSFEAMAEEEMAIEEAEEEEVEDMSVYVFAGHSDALYCVAIHPTIPGLVATGGGDDRAYLWHFPTLPGAAPSTPPIELVGHSDTVTSVGFNFNGHLLLTSSYDGTVKIWAVPTGQCNATLEGPEDVEWATWHPRGNAILAGSKDGTIWMWLAHTGQCMMVFLGHQGLVSCGLFGGEGGKVVCSGGEDGTVRLWQPRTGMCKYNFDQSTKKEGHEAIVTCIDTREEMIVTGSMDGTARVFHTQTNKLLQVFVHSSPRATDEGDEEEIQGVEAVAFSPTPLLYLATGGGDQTLKIWDLNSSHPTPRSLCPHEGSVVSLRWHSSLPIVCSASLDKKIRLWDGRNGRCLLQLTGHSEIITQMALSSLKVQTATGEVNKDIIVSISDDHTARVFEVDFQSLSL